MPTTPHPRVDGNMHPDRHPNPSRHRGGLPQMNPSVSYCAQKRNVVRSWDICLTFFVIVLSLDYFDYNTSKEMPTDHSCRIQEGMSSLQ